MGQNNSSANWNIWLVLIISIISLCLIVYLTADKYTANKQKNFDGWFEFLKRRGDDMISIKNPML